MKKYLIFLLIPLASSVFAQELYTPAEKSSFSKTTGYDELSQYIQMLDSVSEVLSVEIIGQSVQDRNLYAMKFSSSTFGKDKSKIRILILAQQHGNEQSGKEGALLLAEEMVKPENKYLFSKIDLAIVPQMNPDGSEVNKRRNGNEMDLNRNHLILTEPETKAIHSLFDKYLFDVTMDVHEFFPFGETWREFGYRNNSDVLMGINTNINVSKKIRELSANSYLPFIKKYFNERNIKNFIYSPGGPPEAEYIRHSTFDINDGRQSFGIQNTFSFIQEGMNGTDSYVENLKHRAENQMTGMRGLIEYSFQNKNEIQKLVKSERELLLKSAPETSVSIQNEHSGNGQKLELPVYSYSTQRDTHLIVENYRPVVESIYDVLKPTGYLIPKKYPEIISWAKNQSLKIEELKRKPGDRIEQYVINSIDSIDFEGDIVVNPVAMTNELKSRIKEDEYIYIPCSQLKGNMILIALEPKSMLGLMTYKQFSHLLVAGQKYPILRVIR